MVAATETTYGTQIEARLAAIERRLDALEKNRVVDTPVEPDLPRLAVVGESLLSGTATQIGRVMLIFGGAYLLRAITDFEYVPTAFGITLGGLYALTWLWLAHRVAHQVERRAGAVFYAFATTALAFPLLIEACTRFELLSGTGGIIALTVYCLLCLGVAGHRHLRSLGWLATGGGALTALILSRATHVAIPTAVFLIALGLASLWAGYVTRKRWGPQWLGAIAANCGVVSLSMLARSELWDIPPMAAPVAGFIMWSLYLASFAFRSHRLGHPLGAFEVLQALFSFAAIAFVSIMALGDGALPSGPVASAALMLGFALYALAFTPGARQARGPEYYFFAPYGLIVIMAGSTLLLPLEAAAAGWSLAAVLLATFSGRGRRVSLSLQCTLLLVASAVVSGFLGMSIHALAGDPLASWPEPGGWHVVIAGCCVACLFIPVAQHSERWGALAGAPQLIVLALSVFEVGGLITAFTAPTLAGLGGSDPSPAVVAALRTVVLAAAATTLALSSRHPRWPEARWLAYPLLILIGLKLAVEDFPHGQPAMLFVALAAVGGALMIVSRLLRLSRPSSA